MDLRKRWKRGDSVEVYSITENKWVTAKINETYTENKTEWLNVLIDNATKKEIDRFDKKNIRPIMSDEKKQKSLIESQSIKSLTSPFIIREHYFSDDIASIGFNLGIIKLDRQYIAIKSILPGSVAEIKGIQSGDVLLNINDTDFSVLLNDKSIHDVNSTLKILNLHFNTFNIKAIEYIQKIIDKAVKTTHNNSFQETLSTVNTKLQDSPECIDLLTELGFYKSGDGRHLWFRMDKLNTLKSINNTSLLLAMATIKHSVYVKKNFKITFGRVKTFKVLKCTDSQHRFLNGTYSIKSKQNDQFVFVHNKNNNYRITKISSKTSTNTNKITWALRNVEKDANYYTVSCSATNQYPPQNGWKSFLLQEKTINLKYQEFAYHHIALPKPRIVKIEHHSNVIKIHFDCSDMEKKTDEYNNIWYEIDITQHNDVSDESISTLTFETKDSPFIAEDLELDNKYYYTFIVRICNHLVATNSDPIQCKLTELSKQYEMISIKVSGAGIKSFNSKRTVYKYIETSTTGYPTFEHSANKNIVIEHHQQRWEFNHKGGLGTYYYVNGSSIFPPHTGWKSTKSENKPCPNVNLYTIFADSTRFENHKYSFSRMKKQPLGIELQLSDLQPKIIEVKSVMRRSLAFKKHIRPGDVLLKVHDGINETDLSDLQSFDELSNIMIQMIQSWNKKQTLSLSFSRQLKQKTFNIIEVNDGKQSTHIVHGKYSIACKRQDGVFTYVKNQNTNVKILKADQTTWVLRETLPDDTHDHYVAIGTTNDKLPPSALNAWRSTEEKQPSIQLQFSEFKISESSKPQIIRTQAVENAIQIYFECDEAMRKPQFCPHINVWYEIEVKELREKHVQLIKTNAIQLISTKILKTKESPFVVDNLENYKKYVIIVRSCNDLSSIDSELSKMVMPLPLPQKPVITNITGRSKTLFVYFTFPKSHDKQLRFEIVTKQPIDSSPQHHSFKENVIKIKHHHHQRQQKVCLPNLTNGVEYEIVIVAINSVGVTHSDPEYAYPSKEPSKPMIAKLEPDDKKIIIRVKCDGYNDNDYSQWFEVKLFKKHNLNSHDEKHSDGSVIMVEGATKSTPQFRRNKRYYNFDFKIRSVENGVSYNVQIIAVTLSGSKSSAISKDIIPIGPPPKPSICKIKALESAVKISIESANDIVNRECKSSFVIESTPPTISQKTELSPYKFTHLNNGIEYIFRIRAINKDGKSDWNTYYTPTTPFKMPPKPSNLRCVAYNNEITVFWVCEELNTPEYFGRYEVESDPPTFTMIVTRQQARFRPLKNGTKYTFTVSAINKVGRKTAISKPCAPNHKITEHQYLKQKKTIQLQLKKILREKRNRQKSEKAKNTLKTRHRVLENQKLKDEEIIKTINKNKRTKQNKKEMHQKSKKEQEKQAIAQKQKNDSEKRKRVEANRKRQSLLSKQSLAQKFGTSHPIVSLLPLSETSADTDEKFIPCSIDVYSLPFLRNSRSPLLTQSDTESTYSDVSFSGIIASPLPVDSKSLNINMDLFKNQYYEKLSCITSNESVTNCESMIRLLNALKYYDSVKNIIHKTNGIHSMQFTNFCCETYQSALNDYIHVLFEHANDLERIYDYIIKTYHGCNIKHCRSFQRHNRNRVNDRFKKIVINDNDAIELSFWIDTYDSMHCYLFHLFDLGFRVRSEESAHSLEPSNIIKLIKNKTSKLNTLNKFERVNNNKFNINIDTIYGDNSTWSEGLYEYLVVNDVLHSELQQLDSFLHTEHYDSDALVEDLDIDNGNSNIIKYFKNEKQLDLIKEYAHYTALYKSSFNTGFSFYYWPAYQTEDKKKKINIDEWSWNIGDRSGYTAHQLYITQKYANIKYEVLNNKIYSLHLMDFILILKKAKEFVETAKAKRMLADVPLTSNLKTGIRRGKPLSIENVIAVILYTDFSELSSAFSATFRRIQAHELLPSIKARNAEYWCWSKTLRETVSHYGDDRWNNGKNNGLKGPFYCGLNFKIIIPEFSIKLNGPTSVSMDVEVAIRFGGDEGIIMYLNNDGDKWSKWLRSFNCSWISCYNGENERLFMGGDYRMRLQTVQIIENGFMYDFFFKALYYFDCMISSTEMDRNSLPTISTGDHVILEELIKHKSKSYRNKFHGYINSTFDAFCNGKTKIIINLFYISTWFSSLTDLIMSKNNRNLISDTILTLFKNINEIIIYTPPNHHYNFDLKELLALVDKSKLTPNNLKILIKSKWVNDKVKPWISNTNELSLIKKHIAKHWSINLISVKHKKEDCLKIERMLLYVNKQNLEKMFPKIMTNNTDVEPNTTIQRMSESGVCARNFIGYDEKRNYLEMKTSPIDTKPLNNNDDNAPFLLQQYTFQLNHKLGFELNAINIDILQMNVKYVAIKSIKPGSQADIFGVKVGDIVHSVNDIELFNKNSLQDVSKTIRQQRKLSKDKEILRLCFGRQKHMFPQLICHQAGSNRVNGWYNIQRQENDTFIFVSNTNSNLKFMKIESNKQMYKWALRETNITNKVNNENNYRDYYTALTSIKSKIPPQYGWQPVKPYGTLPVVKIRYNYINVIQPSKPIITNVEPMRNAIKLEFECNETNRKPIACRYMKVWYEIHYNETNKTNMVHVRTTEKSPFTVTELANDKEYQFIVRTCNCITFTNSDKTNKIKPLQLPPKPKIVSITGKPNELFIHFVCVNAMKDVKYEIIVDPLIEDEKNQEYPINKDHQILIDNIQDIKQPIRLANLINGQQYAITVSSVTSIGASYCDTKVVYPSKEPPQPIMTNIEAGNREITVYFDCDEYDRYDIKAWFQIELEIMDICNNFIKLQNNYRYSKSPIKIKNVMNGLSYRMRIKSVTLSGFKFSQYSKIVIPKGPPPIPKINKLIKLESAVQIQFECDDLLDMTNNYKVKVTFEIEATSYPQKYIKKCIESSPYIFPNLNSRRDYKFTIRSVNNQLKKSNWSKPMDTANYSRSYNYFHKRKAGFC